MDKMHLGDVLIKLNMITREALTSVMEEAYLADKSFDRRGSDDFALADVLRNKRGVSEEQLIPVLEYLTGVAYMDVRNCNIEAPAIRSVPESVARKYCLIPVFIHGSKLKIAMSDPLNMIALDDLRIITDYEPEVCFSFQSDILSAITANYVTSELAEQAMEEITQQQDIEEDTTQEEIEDEVSRAPVVRLINSLFNQAATMGASDIHIEPMEKSVKVRFRKDGDLREIMSIPRASLAAIISRIKIISGLDIAEKRVPQDGRFGLVMNGKAIDFRVSVLPVVHGEKVVIRILDRSNVLVSRAKLGFSDHNSALFDTLIKIPEGVILLSGPTGSGKTTTLYAILRELNHPAVNIITVEDPVEYHLDGIHQVQVNQKAGLTFASGLRSILRQDPDIIMVGEIRDAETADIATKAAITGHIVLSTIHTNDTASTVSRLADMGIEHYMISSAVKGVVAQRLVKRLCTNCRREKVTTPEEMVMLRLDRPVKINEPGGCNACSGTGYSGRIGVHEILVMDRAIRNMVTGGATADTIKEKAVENGMHTLSQSCRMLVLQGVTSLTELNRIAHSVDE